MFSPKIGVDKSARFVANGAVEWLFSDTLRQNKVFIDTPILIVSASVFEADQSRSIAAGANAFLSKPIHFEYLLDKLTELLSVEWEYVEELAVSEIEPNSNTSQPIIPPDASILEQLLHLAMMGDLQAIEGKLSQLKENHPECTAFALELSKLVSSFQTKRIREFLKSFALVELPT